RVERVKEFDHRGPFGGQELNVVDDQTACAAKASAEAIQGPRSHRVQKAVCECLGGELNDLQFRVKLLEPVVDSFQKVGLSQANSAVDQQRIKRLSGCLGHLGGGCVRHAVSRPGHKLFQPAKRPCGRFR